MIIFRPAIDRRIYSPLLLVGMLFLLHAAIRFGGLNNPLLIPLSMVIIWPLPWLLSGREGRKTMGFHGVASAWWFVTGPVLALAILLLTALAAWLFFGHGESNWLAQHALALGSSIDSLPAGTSVMQKFWILTLPAIIFSPLAEEFLFRGYMQSVFAQWYGVKTAVIIQASAFAAVHLAHYGLQPFQPDLILLWLPSMFLAAIFFGWILLKSKSIWCAVISHAAYNLGMNGVAFLQFNEQIGL